jgi:hypothetical protein
MGSGSRRLLEQELEFEGLEITQHTNHEACSDELRLHAEGLTGEQAAAGNGVEVVGVLTVAVNGSLRKTTHSTAYCVGPDGELPAPSECAQGSSKRHHTHTEVTQTFRIGSGQAGEGGAAGKDVSLDVSEQPAKSSGANLPWGYLVLVMLAVASDAFALMGPMPFLPQMCERQFGVPAADVGYFVGLFTGAYSIANFCTSWLIGHLSDLYGRNGFVLIGLLVSAVLTAGLAFTSNIWVAISFRLLTGALNANFALSRAQIADLVPNGYRAMPYAYLGATFALARTFSSGLAGLSVGLFTNSGIGPYVAPCILLAIPSAVTFFLIVCILPETHQVQPPNSNRRSSTPNPQPQPQSPNP